ncbi:hypothetical protein ACM39_14020 [Chryseobacterium sp. FH2]|uniref:outer membrane beta-barrel protein n=1 Tax=Chryseobacterium sp. FH2 TaxID=1674291 RepID=UPI00065AA7E0|nr:outer membrane beta-barrel protein [Chryseobacterium sp. FH2]KMQ67264.1 hypothetical protein ACM39_14020 [Chryseobacterium sp. FH2]
MKKLLLTGAVAFFGLSDAQINTGTTYVSGQINYSKSNLKTETPSGKKEGDELKISPSIGVFVASNFAVGTSVGFLHTKWSADEFYDISNSATESYFSISNKSNIFEVAPFVRKYFTLSDKLYFFGHLEIPIQFGKLEGNGMTTTIDPMTGFITVYQVQSEHKISSIGVRVKPGVEYFLSKNWTVEATLGEFGYKSSKTKGDEGSVENYNFGLNLSSVTLGIKYVFTK